MQRWPYIWRLAYSSTFFQLINSPTYLTMTQTDAIATKGAIVIGSGLAGLSAAAQLITHDVPVTMIERAPRAGGNSIKASSGINGAPTKFQPVQDELFYPDTVKSAGAAFKINQAYRESLITALTGSSAEAIKWLTEDIGVELSKVAQLGGHSRPRTHRGSGKLPPGAAIVTTLLKKLQSSPLFTLLTSTNVTKVLKTGSTVTGVEYVTGDQTNTLQASAIVFASGGFAGDSKGLLAQHRPDLAGFPSTNEAHPGSHKLLTDIGAQLIDMEMVQVHPTGFVDPAASESPLKFLAAEVLRGEGGILLSGGKRFVNELQTRQVVTNAVLATPVASEVPKQWDVQILLDEGAYEAAQSHVGFYLFKKIMQKVTVKELEPVVAETLQEYARVVAGEAEDALGRTTFGHWTLKDVTPDTVLYVGRVTPVVHFTMGGAIINDKAEVLDSSGQHIDGLWAAGEITGGVHGENRLAGSSLLECVVFGRKAGEGAAAHVAKTTV